MSGWIWQPLPAAASHAAVPTSLVATEGADVAALALTVAAVPIFLAATEGADVAVFSGTDTAVLIATEGADVAALTSSDTVALTATEAGDIAALVGADTAVVVAIETADVAAVALTAEPIPEFALSAAEEADVAALSATVEATPDFLLVAVEAGDVAALAVEAEAAQGVALAAVENADASVFDIVRQGNIILSASEESDEARVAVTGPSEETVGGYSRGRGEPFVWPKKEVELFLRSSEEPDEASFRVMEWARTDEGRRVLRRRRGELVLMMVN